MDERPESVEILPGTGEAPGAENTEGSSNSPLLSGEVAPFQEGSVAVLGESSPPIDKGMSNGAWFAIGLILVPFATWVLSFIMMNIADPVGQTGPLEDIFIFLTFAIWPVTAIGCTVWGFVKGNKYFAYGVLTSMVAVPGACFLILFIFLVAVFGV